ncbi:MAG: Stealth CR1 domain-containing protein, partial [Ignavibacteriae bacterium]|nr:Stealth CR1 domain-containing protein [Ignavibacteriota bacterium]
MDQMKIDIVYTWVDGSDPHWRNRKLKRAKE